MATFTDVDIEQIRLAAQDISRNIDTMKRLGNTLESRVLNELATSWQGESKDLFVQQFTSFNLSLKRLLEEYEALNNDLESAGGDYQNANSRITDFVNQLQ